MDIKDKTSSITPKFTAAVFRSFPSQLLSLCAVPLLVVGKKEAHSLIKVRFEAQGSNLPTTIDLSSVSPAIFDLS